MLYEILKNSMRAVVEHHGANNYDLPPINVIIANGSHDFAIKISDQGGGIGRRDCKKIWSYLHTTARKPIDLDDYASGKDLYANVPMAGFGYGLPLSRLFAQYFGGDLKVISMDGYGTDAYLYLNKLGEYNLNLD
jgi:pyruvate dehydrogenase kinase 2/3/4